MTMGVPVTVGVPVGSAAPVSPEALPVVAVRLPPMVMRRRPLPAALKLMLLVTVGVFPLSLHVLQVQQSRSRRDNTPECNTREES